jgi:outer membrane immunogenic protein
MKTKKIFYTVCTTTLAIILTGLTQAHAGTAPEAVQPQGSEFSGGYVGFKLGENRSNASGVAPRARHDTTFPGLVAGYAFDAGPLVLGAEVFTDFHHGSATGKDGGLDAKVGVPVGKLMPYARLGFTGSWPDTRLVDWEWNISYPVNSDLPANGPPTLPVRAARNAEMTVLLLD